jgi:hypothetical protein
MNKLAIIVLSAAAAGCTGPSAHTDGTARRERAETVTGSNLPQRRDDRSVTIYDREAFQRAQDASYGMERPKN